MLRNKNSIATKKSCPIMDSSFFFGLFSKGNPKQIQYLKYVFCILEYPLVAQLIGFCFDEFRRHKI
jgi:hypothetical protein